MITMIDGHRKDIVIAPKVGVQRETLKNTKSRVLISYQALKSHESRRHQMTKENPINSMLLPSLHITNTGLLTIERV